MNWKKSVFVLFCLGVTGGLVACGGSDTRGGGSAPVSSNSKPSEEGNEGKEDKKEPEEEPVEKPPSTAPADLSEEVLKTFRPKIVLSGNKKEVGFKEIKKDLIAEERIEFPALYSETGGLGDGTRLSARLVFSGTDFPEKVLEISWTHRWRALGQASDQLDDQGQLRPDFTSGEYAMDLEALLKKVEAAGGGGVDHGVELQIRFLSGRSAKLNLRVQLTRELPKLEFKEEVPTTLDQLGGISTERLKQGVRLMKKEVFNPSQHPVLVQVGSERPQDPIFYQWIRTFRFPHQPTTPTPPAHIQIYSSSFAPELVLEWAIEDSRGRELSRQKQSLGAKEQKRIQLEPSQKLVLVWIAHVAARTPRCALPPDRTVTYWIPIPGLIVETPLRMPIHLREYDEILGHEIDVHLKTEVSVGLAGDGKGGGFVALQPARVDRLKWSAGHQSSPQGDPFYSCQGVF